MTTTQGQVRSPRRSGIYTLSLHDALPISGISAEKVTEETITFLKDKGHDISDNISKSVDNLPNLDHYQVVVALSETGQNAFPAPPTKTISIAWELGQAEGDNEASYNFLSQNINDLVQAILGHTSNNK